ncbi:MAG TPA: ATP-binding protein [Vicinamibacterales bacterium]|nr:ATP-binding protein [Vicinamibacterales bacterium]
MVHIPWWRRLGVRLAAAITLCSVLTLTLFLALVLRSQRRHLLDQAQRGAAVVSDTITSSIELDMLHDRREAAYQIMAVIGGQPHVEHLRLLDAGGRVRFSTDHREIGRTLDVTAPTCAPCHTSAHRDEPLSTEARTRLATHEGRPVLGAVTPIYNQASCSSAGCHVHPSSQRVLGVVELGLRLDAIDQEASALHATTAGLALAAALMLGAVTVTFTRRMVIRPVRNLVAGTKRVSLGDLAHTIAVTGSDELAVLQTSFNSMERSLAQANEERNLLLEGLERQVHERTVALERAQAQLIQTEKLSSLGRLSASIAHEINNPLAGILTTAKLLIRTIDSEADDPQTSFLVRHLRLVQRETERCSAIVRNLLGFARERPLTLDDVDLNAALDEALFLAANQISLQNITLDRARAPLPHVRADFGQIRQAFANVVLNACDAMPKGGTLSVRSGASEDGGSVEVTIADTGCGIPPDVLSKVLDPFFTTKEKGTGLGLSVVYGVVERHGGRLTIDSTAGAGTNVTIRLPATAAVPRTPALPAHGA